MNVQQSAHTADRKINNITRSLTLGLLLLGIAAPGFGATVVAPNSLVATEGNTNNGFPFKSFSSRRYQQVYRSSEFGDFSGPELITRILLRPDGDVGKPFGPTTLTDVQVSLSTTTVNPDGMSATFADNVGADEQEVFNGPLELSSADTGPAGGEGPRDFDIVINLRTPFLYDPGNGNLLLDIRNNVPASGGSVLAMSSFDAHDESGDPVSRVTVGNADSATGVAESFGLVTLFESMEGPALTEVAIDIKFCSDPNPFNCKSRGVTPMTIFGTASFDVVDINPDSLQLCLEDLSACTNGPRNYGFDDRGDPNTDLGAGMCATNPNNGHEEDFLNQDGYFDMDAKFESREIQAMLDVFCDGPKNSVSESLIIIGETYDGTPFSSVPEGSSGIDQLVKKGK